MKRSDVLLLELPKLIEAGCLDEEQAERIRAYYRSTAVRRNNPATALLAALAAMLVCAGIILLLAYNWAALPRAVKTGIALLAAAGPGAAGVLLLQAKRPRGAGIVESLALAQVLLFGSGLALIGQIYHTPTHLVLFLGIWAAEAAAAAYIYRSLGAAAVAAALGQAFALNLDIPSLAHSEAGLIAALTLIPLAVLFKRGASPRRAGWTWALFAAAVGAVILEQLIDTRLDIWTTQIAALALLYAAGGRLLRRWGDPMGRSIARFGNGLGIALAFIGSWTFAWEHSFLISDSGFLGTSATALICAALVMAALSFIKNPDPTALFELTPLLIVLADTAAPDPRLSAALSGLAVLLYAAYGFTAGWRGASSKAMNGAFLLALAFGMARFFDATESLLLRGAVFMAAGVGLFIFNKSISKALAARRKEGDHAAE